MDTLTAAQARCLFMSAQGLASNPDRAAGPAALERLIDQLGFVQVDSIICIERAHHLTLRTRLSGYRKAHLQTLLERRVLFEHWTHDASVIPSRWLEHWEHREGTHDLLISTFINSLQCFVARGKSDHSVLFLHV